MNKYEKALNDLLLGIDYDDHLETISELVERATPITPQQNTLNSNIGICKCRVVVNKSFNYCPYCGQKLDWSV